MVQKIFTSLDNLENLPFTLDVFFFLQIFTHIGQFKKATCHLCGSPFVKSNHLYALHVFYPENKTVLYFSASLSLSLLLFLLFLL